MQNLHAQTVTGFGQEWQQFDQSGLSEAERNQIFTDYFRVLPQGVLNADATGFDLGSGSGRWAACVAPQVAQLHCIDASIDALAVAKKNLAANQNVSFHHATIETAPMADGSMDFGYSLGVLHHLPDTAGALQKAVAKLRPGGWFLVYLYYKFDNMPLWYRALWQISDGFRRMISRLPFRARSAVCEVIAATVYWPLARIARAVETSGRNPAGLPLAYYRDKSFYTMRTDALDRFGTQLEKRFTRPEIEQMMRAAGLENIQFSNRAPFWVATGQRT